MQMVSYLCHKISSVEWSGLLFYEVFDKKGNELSSTEEIIDKEITVNPLFIHPLNKGTSAYTEYKFDLENLLTLYEEKPWLKGKLIGHIHSHQKMQVYFSGTDDSQLSDGALDNEIFFSLIVNNDMETVAAFSFQGEEESITRFSFTDKEISQKKPVVFKQMVKTEKEIAPLELPEGFEEQVKKICTPAKPKTAFKFNPNKKSYNKVRNGSIPVPEEARVKTLATLSIRKALFAFLDNNLKEKPTSAPINELWTMTYNVIAKEKHEGKKETLEDDLMVEFDAQMEEVATKQTPYHHEQVCIDIYAYMDAATLEVGKDVGIWLGEFADRFASDYLMEEMDNQASLMDELYGESWKYPGLVW